MKTEIISGAIYEAIPAILADVDAIGKNRKNQQQGYSFRGIDDVYNAIHPLLAQHKVFPTCEIVSREVTERETKAGGVLFYVNLKAKYTLHAHDGSSVTTEAWGEAMDSGDKATNKAMSAAYKYALFQLLCIPTEAVDSEQDTHDVAPKRTDIKPKADRIAQEHGMTTGDKVQPPAKSMFDSLKERLNAFDASAPDASKKLTVADDFIYKEWKERKAISDAEKHELDFMVAEIQREIDAARGTKREPAAA